MTRFTRDQALAMSASRAAQAGNAAKRVLQELLEASEEMTYARIPIEQRQARLILAQNSARNFLKLKEHA
jgi:hypothetical protein